MKTSIRFAVVAILLAAATPALAFTVTPATSDPTNRQFTDPDDALEATTSSLRDQVRDNNLPFQGSASQQGYGFSGYGQSGTFSPNAGFSSFSSPGYGYGDADAAASQDYGQSFGPPVFARRH